MAGNSFTTWIEALHEIMVLGFPNKVIVTLFGALVSTLSVTGDVTRPVVSKSQVQLCALNKLHRINFFTWIPVKFFYPTPIAQ